MSEQRQDGAFDYAKWKAALDAHAKEYGHALVYEFMSHFMIDEPPSPQRWGDKP